MTQLVWDPTRLNRQVIRFRLTCHFSFIEYLSEMLYHDLYVHNPKAESCHQFGFNRPIKIDSSDWTLGIESSFQVFTVIANVNRIPEQRR